MSSRAVALSLLTATFFLSGTAYTQSSVETEVILQRYADAWRGEQEMALPREVVVAIWVRGEGGADYTITIPQAGRASLSSGIAADYDLGFELTVEFLLRLDHGELSALTAMGQARSTDSTPLVPKFGQRFQTIPDAPIFFRRFAFHFWNREWPETVKFGDGLTREVHGGNTAVLYYDQEFRSAWYQLKPGMHINPDPTGQTNPYPQTVIVTRGMFQGRIDGQERVMREGEMTLIPAGTASEFWTNDQQYGEFIWLGFGRGA